MKKKKDFWLFHPGIVNKKKGYTGRYRPAPNHTITGEPQLEIEQIITSKDIVFMKVRKV